ncbi:MAG: hypothetical protein AAF675_08100 [Pseudomonadota bacterium]
MKAHTASLINALVLIAGSVWAVLAGVSSVTAMIPAAFGIALLLCYTGVKAENKLIAHIAAVLTLIVVVALFMPLSGAIGRGDMVSATRVGLMQASAIFAMVFFIKSFVDARRRRA